MEHTLHHYFCSPMASLRPCSRSPRTKCPTSGSKSAKFSCRSSALLGCRATPRHSSICILRRCGADGGDKGLLDEDHC
eukprot:scaffold154321_cov33-Tisochrysis_lutea.AAC.2